MATAQGCSKPGCLQAATDRFMCGAGHHPYCSNEHRKKDVQRHKTFCRLFQTHLKKVNDYGQYFKVEKKTDQNGVLTRIVILKNKAIGGLVHDSFGFPLHLESVIFFNKPSLEKLTLFKAPTITLIGLISVDSTHPKSGFWFQSDCIIVESQATISCPGSITIQADRLVLKGPLVITFTGDKQELVLRKHLAVELPNGEKTTIKTGEDLNEFLVNSAANFPRPAVEKRPIELSEPAGS